MPNMRTWRAYIDQGLAKRSGRLVLPLAVRRQALPPAWQAGHTAERWRKYFPVPDLPATHTEGAIPRSLIFALTMNGSGVRNFAAADNNYKVIANSVMGTGCGL